MKDPLVFITHILQSIDAACRYVEGVGEEEFAMNEQLQDAVVRRLEIIGEAVRNIPDTFKASHPDVPWRDIVDFLNVLIHEYFTVDTDMVWAILKKDLPALRLTMTAILHTSNNQTS